MTGKGGNGMGAYGEGGLTDRATSVEQIDDGIDELDYRKNCIALVGPLYEIMFKEKPKLFNDKGIYIGPPLDTFVKDNGTKGKIIV